MKYAIIILLLILVSGCSERIPVDNGSLEVYFCPQANCTNILFTLNSHCAVYDYNPELVNQFIIKNISILVDSDNYEEYGKSIYGRGLMHHKFCVNDNKIITTGSFNPTIRGEFHNNNNLLKIHSKLLSENYHVEYSNILSGKHKKTPNPKILFNGFMIENYFCPRDNCQENVLRTLETANSSIYFMTFSFTDNHIGNLLIDKSKSMEVSGIFEKTQNSKYSEFEKMQKSGMNITWDKNKYTMHNKVFIIDKKIVITGSYNPTKNANENNRENILIIHNEEVARVYLEEFYGLKQ